MFDCKQDIGFLHDSLLSVAYSNSNNLFECDNVKDAVYVIHNSIKMIIHHSLKEAKTEKEKIDIQLYCNERLHAALFFTTLRSYDIKSQAADEFYDSILHNWPSMNLKFYVELNFKCDWSEYFVMCALQLPSETLLNILKNIFEIPFESDLKCYSLHLILQTLIFKLLEMPYNKEIHYPFNFDLIVKSAVSINEKSYDKFTEKNCETVKVFGKIHEENHQIIENTDENNVSNNSNETLEKENEDSIEISNKIVELEDTEEEDEYLTPFSYKLSDDDDNDDEITKTKNEDLTLFKELCCKIYDNIALKLKELDNISILKILLHVAKIISRNLKTELKRDDTRILPFVNYVKLLKDYLSSDICQEKLKIEMKECTVIFTRLAYASVTWNVCLNYLVFVLKHYIEGEFPSIPCSDSPSSSNSFHKNLISVIDCLWSLNYSSLKSDEHMVLLCKIIQFEFEGSCYAAKFFLSEPDILKRNNILATLEENCHVINLSYSYHLLIDHIISTDSPELKQNLLKILYKCLQMNKLEMYNTVIGYIIANYGLSEEFQLPDYHELLSNFAYKTPTQEEIAKKVPALLIQNPKHTLKYLIDETLLQGPEGEIFIQLLKHFKNACFYVKKSSPASILQEILNDYFNKPKLEPLFLKNMITLYRFLAQVHSETPILLPCTFFSECIIPKLHPEYEKIGLVLECANVLVPALLSDDSFSKDSEIFCDLITKFGILANYYIEKSNGEMKSLILPILKDLEIHQQKYKQMNEKQKLKLWLTFKNFNEMTCVYLEEFLPGHIELASRAAIWIRCCKNETAFDEKFSVENLTYTSLVNTLVEVLPCLTKKEWSYCFNLIKVCCENNKVREEITDSNNLFQLSGSELETYVIVSTIVTSVHFILNNNIDGSLYVSSCMSNFLKDAVFQGKTVHPHLLLSVALEICHLISFISPDIIHIYYATLLEMKKEIYSHSLQSHETDYSKLLNHVITCLPNLHQNEISK